MKNPAIDYKSVLSFFLPKGLLDYFDIVGFSDMGSYYMISLEEVPAVPCEYSHLGLVSKGFYPEVVITDFPARDRTVYLKVKRRRWEDSKDGRTYHRDRSLIAQGTRITQEFADFLKELH